MKEQNIYKVSTLILLPVFLGVFLAMNHNYNELLETNDQLVEMVEENRENYNNNIIGMQEKLNDLEIEKRELERGNTRLQEYVNKQDKINVALAEEYAKLKKELENIALLPYTDEEIYLLAKCVQSEAGEPTEDLKQSQKYITQVILNRVEAEDFPNSISEVIYEKHGGIPQFSVTVDGALDKCVLNAKTLMNVYDVLLNGTDLPSYVKYFYCASVKENWVCSLNTYKTTGGTVFAYSDKDRI